MTLPRRDVHAAIRPDAAARRLQLLCEFGMELYARLTPSGEFVETSSGLAALLGYSPEYLAGARLLDVVDGEDAALLAAALQQLAARTGVSTGVTLRVVRSVTQTAWVELTLVRDDASGHDDGGADGGGILLTGRDISAHRQRIEDLERLAAHDPLTGLPNRALLTARIEQALAQHRRGGPGFALAVADLDGFKRINDTLGHAVGDDLLKHVATRLQRELRGVDTVARLGGDEFVLVLPEIQRPDQADALARRIIDGMGTPFLVREHTLFVTLSVGFALHPQHGADADALLHSADAALYRAKELGRNRWQVFDEGLATRKSEYFALEQAMFDAVRNGEFLLHYQPIARSDGTVVGAEALMRWPRAGGMVSPADFIPIAENNGLIGLLGAWALRTACHQAMRWERDGLPPLSVSVNVSPRQFRHGDFFAQVRRALEESGMPAARLVLEITEGVLLHDPEHAGTVLVALQALGVRIAVDDFGTGYSSLAYLRRLPIASLKIDRSFVRDMTESMNDLVIVSAVLSLARELGLDAVAEGVETAGQLALLREKGCPYVQGYFIGRPLPADDFAVRVRPPAAVP